MSSFTGRLTVIGSQSSLDDGSSDHLILKAGIPDPAQATFAATQFLLKTRHLNPGQVITVIGEQGIVGQVSVIVMLDAHAAGVQPFDEHALMANRISAEKPRAGKGSKKAAAKKAAKGTARAKKAASQKSTRRAGDHS